VVVKLTEILADYRKKQAEEEAARAEQEQSEM
jgi:hypothetical protein